MVSWRGGYKVSRNLKDEGQVRSRCCFAKIVTADSRCDHVGPTFVWLLDPLLDVQFENAAQLVMPPVLTSSMRSHICNFYDLRTSPFRLKPPVVVIYQLLVVSSACFDLENSLTTLSHHF